MRIRFSYFALAAALAAAPAAAQVGVNLGGRVGAGVGVNTGRVVDNVRGTLDRTVDTADRQVNRTLRSDARVAARADVRTGVAVRDSSGRRIGTVQSVHGNTAVIVQGNRHFHVPLSSLYRSSSGLVTGLSRAELRASTEARGGVHH